MKSVSGKALWKIVERHGWELKKIALSRENLLVISLHNYSIHRVVFIKKNEKVKAFLNL